MPSLVEVLHPLRKASQKDQVLGVLYWYSIQEGVTEVTTGQVREALVRARLPRAVKINVTRALNKATPYVDRIGPRGIWALTETGTSHIEGVLGIGPNPPAAKHDVGNLHALASSVPDDSVRGYIEEAVTCLEVGALRAAVVFLWTGAVATLRDDLWPSGAKEIEQSLQRTRQNAKFKRKDDFVNVKDVDLLQLAQDLGRLDKTEKQTLHHALDLRNACGHPTKYRPGAAKVGGFIEDLLGIVFA